MRILFLRQRGLKSALQALRHAASQNSVSHSRLKFRKKFCVEFYAEFYLVRLRGWVKFRVELGAESLGLKI